MEQKNLWSALSKAQGEIKEASKTVKNDFFKSKYADLASVIESIQPVASKHGLSVIFDMKTDIVNDAPIGWICYTITHDSGERFQSSWICMFMKDKTPQGFGASLTYYRRQLLKTIYQIPEGDDDGNSQSQTQNPPPFQQQQKGLPNYAKSQYPNPKGTA